MDVCKKYLHWLGKSGVVALCVGPLIIVVFDMTFIDPLIPAVRPILIFGGITLGLLSKNRKGLWNDLLHIATMAVTIGMLWSLNYSILLAAIATPFAIYLAGHCRQVTGAKEERKCF